MDNFGLLSLIPPILAVALAFATKNVVLSLFIALFSGCLIVSMGNPWAALQITFSDYLFVDMTSGSNAQTIVLMAVIGGFVALVEKSGGARAFAQAISSKLTAESHHKIVLRCLCRSINSHRSIRSALLNTSYCNDSAPMLFSHARNTSLDKSK